MDTTALERFLFDTKTRAWICLSHTQRSQRDPTLQPSSVLLLLSLQCGCQTVDPIKTRPVTHCRDYSQKYCSCSAEVHRLAQEKKVFPTDLAQTFRPLPRTVCHIGCIWHTWGDNVCLLPAADNQIKDNQGTGNLF